MKKIKLFVLVMIISMLCTDVFAQSGANDPSFDPTYEGFDAGTGANRAVYSTSFQTDEKIIIAGSFTYFNGSSRRRIARLNTDGSVDISFDPGSGASQNSTIYTTSLQSDGKIIIGGNFTSYNLVQRSRVARVNTDGTLDGTFNPGSGTGMNSTVYASAIQSDGKIIIGGYFSNYNNKSRNCIARVNTNGSLDTTFNPGTGANNTIYAVAIQADGKIIIGGSFTAFNGTSINRVARLNADGSLDATFVPGTGAGGTVRTLTLQSDGKIVIGGNFTSFNGATVNRIARLNTDGTIDNSFVTGVGASAYVRKTVVQTDGKIVIGGEFVTFNGTSKKRIVRLNSDGSVDASFVPGSGADSNIVAMAVK
ncbi:MAG TPA: delta-60 repeat domain-containing protein, partial [Bacteroidales bacterium]|nr:delta-60 repeat domain-containing protein [Bacteroidales bacterium]